MSPPIRDILAATDFSRCARRATDRAIRLAREHGSRLRLVHALEDPGWMAAAIEDPQLPLDRLAIEDAALRALAGERDRLADGRIAIETVLLDGPPHRALPEHLAARPADLLVAGTQGENVWHARLLGSVAERVLQLAVAPVLLVRNPADDDYRRLVVATDFSPASMHAAEVALALAPAASPLLFHAHLPPFHGSLAFTGVSEEVREAYRRDAALEAMDALEAFARNLESSDRRLVPALREGPPGQTLSKLVEEASVGLVAMGAQGRSRLERFLLGSTSRQAAANLPCDVLIVPDLPTPGPPPTLRPATMPGVEP